MLCFNETVRFPLSVPVLSWLLSVRRPPREGQPRPSTPRAWPGPPRGCPPRSPSWVPRLPAKARHTQPLEPILFPKLRIYFADFPYLHCSINQRLFTLETCCGYEYDQV